MQARVRVTDLTQGQYIVRIGKHEVGATFASLRAVSEDTPTRGPRGGRYRLTAHGADVMVAVVTSRSIPIVPKTATAVVEVVG